ncbi:MAG: suppressor of fused domain protein [Spirochaetia bacterium]|nr:suppressor of fused domain protein [Spirochaetia bacterium]
MAEERDYEKLVSKIRKWHEAGEHEKIVRALEEIPETGRDYGLAGFYARALNNLGRYEEALGVLLGFAQDGKEDGIWHFRVGYSLYYLGREAEASVYFQKAVDYGDDGEDTRQFLEASRGEAEAKAQQGSRRPEIYTEEEMDCIQAHVGRYFGNNKNVFHELVSPDIHVDILAIEPGKKHDYYVLVTMGMGAHRMNVPEDLKEYRLGRAELLVCLPPDWRLDEEAMKDENWYWPLRWLKIMARLPGEQDTWLGWGHTVPNDGPFAENTRFTAMMLVGPGAFGEKSLKCEMPDGSFVNFYQMVPLYEEEVQFKLKTNAELLLKLFDNKSMECVDIHRQNACKR